MGIRLELAEEDSPRLVRGGEGTALPRQPRGQRVEGARIGGVVFPVAVCERPVVHFHTGSSGKMGLAARTKRHSHVP